MDEAYIKFAELLYDQRILPKNLNIPSRQVTYWRSKKILPYFDQQQKHGKMNIPQAIWLLIVKELSDIGISSERLAKLSKDVWVTPKEEKYADKIISENIKSTRNQLTESTKAMLRSQLSDKLLMNTLREDLNPYTDMLKSLILSNNEPHSLIYVPTTGEHKFLTNDSNLILNLISSYSQNSVICIPILDKLSKIVSYDFSSKEKDLKYLTEIENQIRNIVMFKRPKIVEIAFDDNHIKPRIITEKHIKQDELANFFLHNKISKNTKLLIEVRSQDNYKLTLITK